MAKRYIERERPAPGAGKLPPEPRSKPRRRKKQVKIWKEAENRIREIIEEWPDPEIDWDTVVAAVDKEFEAGWTRQTLSHPVNHKKILKAFQDKKVELRNAREAGGAAASKSADSRVQYLERAVHDLTEENAALKVQIAERDARLARWRENAYLHRLTLEMLDAPLQTNDRGRSDR